MTCDLMFIFLLLSGSEHSKCLVFVILRFQIVYMVGYFRFSLLLFLVICIETFASDLICHNVVLSVLF